MTHSLYIQQVSIALEILASHPLLTTGARRLDYDVTVASTVSGLLRAASSAPFRVVQLKPCAISCFHFYSDLVSHLSFD